MKKILTAMLCFCLLFMSGCTHSDITPRVDGRPKIVVTIFPAYDWLKEIMGDAFESADVTFLLQNGVDMHSYQPTAQDMIRIARCDMFIYVGGESDSWTTDALSGAVNPHMTTVNLSETLGNGLKTEEYPEGMKAEEDEAGYDEHVWLSLRNTILFCNEIAEKLSRIDSVHRDVYTANAAAYIKKLQDLDCAYQDVIDSAAVKVLLFGDRFPFRYMTDDYGLSYYAAFPGCSAETEASFETIVTLAGKADTLGLHAILRLESGDGKIADTIRQNTATKNQVILTIDSMQSKTSNDIQNGVTYLSVMEKNLEVLKEALH